MKKFLNLLTLALMILFFQGCTKKDAPAENASDRKATDASTVAGSCKTKSSEACADYFSDSAASLATKLKQSCETGDGFGAGTYSTSLCTSASTRVGRCSFPKKDSETSLNYSVVINYYGSMNISAAQVETACVSLHGTYQAN